MEYIFNSETAICICIICVLTITIISAINNHYSRKHVRLIYELFEKLHRESELRIGNANSIVTQSTRSIEKAAIASDKCATAADHMASMMEHIAQSNIDQIEELRQDKNRMFEQTVTLTKLFQESIKHSDVNYITHNH